MKMEKDLGLILIFIGVFFWSCKTNQNEEPKYIKLSYNVIDLVEAFSNDTLHLGEIISRTENKILINTMNKIDTFSNGHSKSIFLNSKLIHSFDSLNRIIESNVAEFPIAGNKSEFLDKYELKLNEHKITIYKNFVNFDDLHRDGLIQAYMAFEDIIYPFPIVMVESQSAIYYELNVNPFDISEKQYDLVKIKLLSDVKFTELFYNFFPPQKNPPIR